MGEAADNRASQRVRDQVIMVNWVHLVGFTLILAMLSTYFLSPYVCIFHNPVDDALIRLIGVEHVKPLLSLFTITGGLMGLVLYPYIHRLYTDVSRNHVVLVGTRRFFVITSGPYIGIVLSFGIQGLWNYVCASPNTGNLLSLFLTLPALLFGIVVALINLIEYYWTNHLASLRGFSLLFTTEYRKVKHRMSLHSFILQFTTNRRQLSLFRLELVPLHGASELEMSDP